MKKKYIVAVNTTFSPLVENGVKIFVYGKDVFDTLEEAEDRIKELLALPDKENAMLPVMYIIIPAYTKK